MVNSIDDASLWTRDTSALPKIDWNAIHQQYPNSFYIHFGVSSRSKYYPEALELADLAPLHVQHGSGADLWHSVVVQEEQLDLLALLYQAASKLPNPKVHGADLLLVILCCRNRGSYEYAHSSEAKYKSVVQAAEALRQTAGIGYEDIALYLNSNLWRRIQSDMVGAREKLIKEGFLDKMEYENPPRFIKAWRRPQEVHPHIRVIKEAISTGDFTAAIERYYQMLGERPYRELTPELLYLKRLAGVELAGRDLLYFLQPSSRSLLVNDQTDEYIGCIDEVIETMELESTSPIAIVKRYAPTMDELIQRTQERIELSVWLEDGEFKRDTKTRIDDNFFGAKFSRCPEGRIFPKYPDQVAHCHQYEREEDPKYHGFWVTYGPEFLQRHVFSKGLLLEGIDAYRHRKWTWRGKRGTREPDFTITRRVSDLEKNFYGVSGIRYTGRTHRVRWKRFYEVDLIRVVGGGDLGNPFLDAAYEILREAENLLRERHGLPGIGEGWISEMRLLELVREVFPDAQHRASPKWLAPQHLDVFIPSHLVAIEYQGRQHFESIDFFGGEQGFQQLKKRDARKARKCKQNKINLIAWHYDKRLDRSNLEAVLQEHGVEIPQSQIDDL